MPSWMWILPALAALVLWLVGRRPDAPAPGPSLSSGEVSSEPVYDPDDEADARAARRSLRPGHDQG